MTHWKPKKWIRKQKKGTRNLAFWMCIGSICVPSLLFCFSDGDEIRANRLRLIIIYQFNVNAAWHTIPFRSIEHTTNRDEKSMTWAGFADSLNWYTIYNHIQHTIYIFMWAIYMCTVYKHSLFLIPRTNTIRNSLFAMHGVLGVFLLVIFGLAAYTRTHTHTHMPCKLLIRLSCLENNFWLRPNRNLNLVRCSQTLKRNLKKCALFSFVNNFISIRRDAI